jgi:CheY-like chemotaxis protein
LSKPYSREQLALKIRLVLNNRQQKGVPPPLDLAAPSPISKAETADDIQAISVLVVEDEPLIRMATVDMLRDLGHTVSEAGCAEEALKYLETQRPDLVLTDLGLPGISGSDFCNEVRSRWPDVAIIFATGMDQGPELSDRTHTALLRKPFGVEDLEAAIRKAF